MPGTEGSLEFQVYSVEIKIFRFFYSTLKIIKVNNNETFLNYHFPKEFLVVVWSPGALLHYM